MASLRDIRDRIVSVKNTRQITRAMKLVAGAKLARATDAATAAKPYQQTLTRVLGRVVQAAGDVEHPLLSQPKNESDVLVVVIATNRGLCGNFNSLILRNTQARVDALVADGKSVRLVCYGKKARAHFGSRGYTIEESFQDYDPSFYPGFADELAARLVKELGANSFSQAFIAFNEFRSVMVQEPCFTQVLPMQVQSLDGAATAESGVAAATEYLYEPSGAEILGRLLPMALRTQLFQAFLESEAGEQAKRMTAMDSATRNASDLIDSMTLTYNRARQAAITKELIEIVSGAEAL